MSTLVLTPGDVQERLSKAELVGLVEDYFDGVIDAATAAQSAAEAAQQKQQVALQEVTTASAAVTGAAQDLATTASAKGTDLDRALGAVDEQYQAAMDQQQQVDATTQTRWAAYLSRLVAGGVTPPPAAALLDPLALPAGLTPLSAPSGAIQPGLAAKPGPEASLLGLPAEAVAAVTAAIDRLGAPYAAKATGPTA